MLMIHDALCRIQQVRLSSLDTAWDISSSGRLASRHQYRRYCIYTCYSITFGQALGYCRTKEENLPILQATKLLVFFAAPHKGLDITYLEAMVQNIERKLQKARMHRIVRMLREDSDFLEAYADEMVEIFGTRKVISFHELKLTEAPAQARVGN